MYMTDLGNWLNTFLTGYVAQVVSQLCSYLWPLGAAMLTLYIANYGYAVMRGEVSEPMEVFAWKVVKLGITMTVALSAGFYMTNINSAFDSLSNGMATVFVSDGGSGDFSGVTDTTGAFGALDLVFNKGTTAVNALWAAASWTSLDLFFASMVFTLGMDIFMFIAGAITVMAKVFMSFALAIGPAAVLCLMFKPTSKFFDSWLSFALSACVMTWFVFFSLGLSLFIVDKVIADLQVKGAFNPSGGGALVSPVDGAMAMLVMYVLTAILIWQSPRLASALTGGPAMSSGASMVMSYVLGRGSSGGGGGDRSSGGGSQGVHGGGGASYGAGKAAGYSYQRVSGLFGGRR